MVYNKDGYRIEKFETRKDGKCFRIRFEWMEEPLSGIIVNDKLKHFKTYKEAEQIAKREARKMKNDKSKEEIR